MESAAKVLVVAFTSALMACHGEGEKAAVPVGRLWRVDILA